LPAVISRRAIVLAILPLAFTAGCGSDSKDSGNSDASTSPGSSTESNGIESKSPQQILDASAAALRSAKTFHLEGKEGGKKPTTAKADVGLPRELRLAITQGDTSASIMVVNGSLYIKANAAFWKQEQTGKAASKLAGRWLKTPASTGELRKTTGDLDPKVLSRCLATDHGTLADGGTATIDGQKAVVIIDKGDRPGTSPGKLYVAATGKPVPLHAIATGGDRPGGKKDPKCDDSPTHAGDEFTFSNFDEPLNLSPPPAAIDLGGTGAAS
jgi:hypothetical protein